MKRNVTDPPPPTSGRWAEHLPDPELVSLAAPLLRCASHALGAPCALLLRDAGARWSACAATEGLVLSDDDRAWLAPHLATLHAAFTRIDDATTPTWLLPLRVDDELAGALLVLPSSPEVPGPEQRTTLDGLARMTEAVLGSQRRALDLAESERVYRQLAENIGAIFWLTDWKERRVIYVSPSWEHIWGQDVSCLFEEEDQKAWSRNIHEEDRSRVVRNFDELSERGEYDEDFRVVHPDGIVRWLHERAFPIRDASGRVVRMAGVAEDITARKHSEAELARARDEIEELRRSEVADLTSELLLAEESERKRLAQELHGGMNQLVTLALLKLAQLKDRVDGDRRGLAAEIEAIVEQAGRSARTLTGQLSPPILHDLGFVPALHWLADEVRQSHGLDVHVDAHADGPPPLGEDVRMLLFRAVRELLFNVADHAGARSACLALRLRNGRLELLLEDDGMSLDTAVAGSSGIGLERIRRRLVYLGGKMRIEPASPAGTSFTLIAPLIEAGDSPGPPRP